MTKWKIQAALSILLILISYWCAAYIDNIHEASFTVIWLGLTSFIFDISALMLGVNAFVEWSRDQ